MGLFRDAVASIAGRAIKPSSVETDKATIKDLAIILEKTSDQSLSASTDTTIDWDNQEVDTDIYTYDATNDDIDVAEAGDYNVSLGARVNNVADQDAVTYKLLVNGTEQRRFVDFASGTTGWLNGSATLRDLSANDTIRVDIRAASAATLNGNDVNTWVTITREG